MMRKVALLAVLGMAFVLVAGAADVLQAIAAASQELSSFRATIHMVRYGKQKAEIEFTFEFVPPVKMRIEYLAPANLKGQLVILNGDQLYTYLPALHRAVRKKVTPGSHHPGEEMGFLYQFVEGQAAAFLAGQRVTVEGPLPFTWPHGEETVSYQAYKVTLAGEEETQVVWCDADTFVPVGVDIYRGGELLIEVRVVKYEYNEELPPEDFAIPG